VISEGREALNKSQIGKPESRKIKELDTGFRR